MRIVPAVVGEYVLREFGESEDGLGLLRCLEGLAPTGLTVGQARSLVEARRRAGILTLVCVLGLEVVGTCSLILERKLIHSGGLVGHLEDVAVAKEYRGRGIGKALVQYALSMCRRAACYKVILDCNAEVAPFYESLGFSRKAHCMRLDLGTESTLAQP